MIHNILIIEDDEFFRGLIGKKVLSGGFNFIIATNGQQGLQKMRDIKPDVVLLDMVMPVKDGFEVLVEIKKDPELHNIPVIVLSNLSTREDIERALKLGADNYLIKSQSNPEAMMALIKKTLDKKTG